jgi:Tfp pilus assembly protein PilO
VSLWRRVYQERRGIILPLVVALVANAGLLAFVVLPLERSVAGAGDESVAAMGRLASARLAEKAARAAKASKERADDELRRFYADVLPPDLNEARRLTDHWLQGVAEQAGLQFKTARLDFAPVRDSQLTKVSEKVTLIGQYSEIRRFLYAVETAPQFVIIERVALGESSTTQGGAAGAAASGLLEIGLDVSTYFSLSGTAAR